MITVNVDVGQIEVDVNEDSGEIVAIILDGKDFLNKTVEELVIASCGGAGMFQWLLSERALKLSEYGNEEKDRPDEVWTS